MKHFKNIYLILLISLCGCSKNNGDHWYEADDGSIVYSICFFNDDSDLVTLQIRLGYSGIA